MRSRATKLQLAYLPQWDVLCCAGCDHYFENQSRCPLITAEDGEVHEDDACRFWWNARMLGETYVGRPLKVRGHEMNAPEPSVPLMTKEEAGYMAAPGEARRCATCHRYGPPGDCALIGDDVVHAEGACAQGYKPLAKQGAEGEEGGQG